MPLSTAHLLLRARQARIAAGLSPDRELKRLLLEIARAYADCAQDGERPLVASARGSGSDVPVP
jgi:hypothetical protein